MKFIWKNCSLWRFMKWPRNGQFQTTLPLGHENVISVVSLSAWTHYSLGMRKKMTVGECTCFPPNKNTKQQSLLCNSGCSLSLIYSTTSWRTYMSFPYFVPLWQKNCYILKFFLVSLAFWLFMYSFFFSKLLLYFVWIV